MKKNYIKIKRLRPLLGIALVGGGVMAAATYLDLERQTRSAETGIATLDRLIQEEQLSAALKLVCCNFDR